MTAKKKYIPAKVIEDCQYCPHSNAFSVDCVAHAHCRHPDGKMMALPADGKPCEELMVMNIPDNCPLEDAQ